MTHFVYIPFTGVGIDNRNDEWFKERIRIFLKYTLQSLLAQNNQNYTLWLSFRPQDRNTALVNDLEFEIYRYGFHGRLVLTFDGLMYHDDKFGGSITHRIWNVGRLVRAAWRNNTWLELPTSLWQMTLGNKNNSLHRRIASSLFTIISKTAIDPGQDVLMTRIDSDDMFRNDAIEKIQERYKSSPEWPIPPCAYVVDKGYIYDVASKQLAEYRPRTNPPFHTIVFPGEIFANARAHKAAYRYFKSHEDITKVFAYDTLEDCLYCVTTHNPKAHISTVFNHPYRGNLIEGEQKAGILKQFGI